MSDFTLDGKMDLLVTHAKTSGFVYQGSEIYGGLQNTWDFGPLGAALRKNIKDTWWNEYIRKNPHNVGIDSAILMNSDVWRTR